MGDHRPVFSVEYTNREPARCAFFICRLAQPHAGVVSASGMHLADHPTNVILQGVLSVAVVVVVGVVEAVAP